jgi:Protein of unknown function (DUF3540)
MQATARKINAFSEPSSSVEMGTVTKVEASVFVVRMSTGTCVDATLAASCLVRPTEGDLVALLPVPTRGHFIVAILERASDEAIALSAPSGLTVSVSKGRFTVAAEGIDLVAKDIALHSHKTTVDAQSIRFSFREFAAFGAEVLLNADTFKLAGRFASAVFESVMHRAARSYRVISELEHMTGRQLSYTVSENVSLHGKNNLMTAEDLVKVDGKQIHVG